MKTKQIKEELDKNTDEEVIEPKTRARKKASDIINEEKSKPNQDEPKTSKKTQPKARAIVKKRPIGIRKALRSKKAIPVKEKAKNVLKAKRGRKPAIKTEPEDKEVTPLIPATEIKKEPIEETSPSSRSSSPKTAGRRVRVSSDMAMLKTVLSDTASTLLLGSRTSPYSMRSERSNSPSLHDTKNLRKPRKGKNLLNEVVIKEQKKRRRLLSDSKNPETAEPEQDCKKLKRGRSCSRDGSEISKCSDNTESDLSMSETLNDSDKEPNKKLDKPKTDLDVVNEINQNPTEKVPSLTDSKLSEPTLPETSIVNEMKNSSLQRSTSLDSDNNNSNRIKVDALNSSDIEDKLSLKTENDPLFQARNNILTSMSRTFNSRELSKNIRRARRGRKAAAEARRPAPPPASKVNITPTAAITEPMDDKHETIETLSKDIDDLIKNLDQNIDGDHELTATHIEISETTDALLSEDRTAPMAVQLTPFTDVDDNSINVLLTSTLLDPETPIKDNEINSKLSTENTPSKNDDGQNIKLHFEEDSVDKSDTRDIIPSTFKCNTVASIDKLMDRLKEFEEFDKRRQKQESESKSNDSKPVMVTNDVVLIHKSGAEFKPLDMQPIRSPERTIEKENVLSCFENNSAISIVIREPYRKSVDIDLPNSVTLIKRNSVHARKESTSSNHSRESDAITIFEKSLGKDVTLTEIRKSADKTAASQVDLHQFAVLHPGNPSQSVAGLLDSTQISITPRLSDTKIVANDIQIITKRKSREDSLTRKSSESTSELEVKAAVIEKIKSPPPVLVAPAPVAIKSPEATLIEAEALPPPIEPSPVSDDIPMATKTPIEAKPALKPEEIITEITKMDQDLQETKDEVIESEKETISETKTVPEKIEIETPAVIEKVKEKVVEPAIIATVLSQSLIKEVKEDKKPDEVKTGRKSARNSLEALPGPSNVFNETPESQKRKENILRTLGLLTHKAAKEAKIEKAKEKERIISERMSNKGKAAKSSGDYTGTLKTVIKLNRGGDKKKHRSSLKMTFQKSKYRSGKPVPEMEGVAEDGTFYTIERREIAAASSADGGQRKTHYSNRLNNHDEPAPEPSEPSETLNLVIPEKASSFSIHPGRLCMDQCFYCGGKFGLFDTPCHIAQIKSTERQKKVLDNEEKLTIDSCLCDACYRHVDRRANCPSYRKRPLPKQSDLPQTGPPNALSEKSVSPGLEEESSSDGAGGAGAGRVATCHTEACVLPADHSIRRKWLIKMRSSVNKVLKLKGDYPGLHTIPLCASHYRVLSPLMACLLCRRRLTKHHNLHFIHHGYMELNPFLSALCIPVQFTSRPVLCKGCRYYCSLLQRPHHNQPYASQYYRKLLKIYNIEGPPEAASAPANTDMPSLGDPTKKKKQRNKSKQRKSTEPDMSSENSSEKTGETTPETNQDKPIEEDIESLISSNRILVPGAKPDPHPSDGSDENSGELPAMNKQTELQYLLQKQNNPAQFLHIPNLSHNQRNIMKLHNASGIQKPGQQHRITDKNAKKIHKIGTQMMHKDMVAPPNEMEIFEDKSKDGIPPLIKNISLNDECTIESIPTKRAPDINTLKNKWQMSESFTQVKKNLSELSKKLTVEKDPKKTEAKYSNPVKRLETNPSISVRELFPGEEEMNLQCNLEFNNVKGVTPEGWEKCNTTIQYDHETRQLWNELQRPYGNQSSFLRHLVLLEKYFRSGDLILSHNASPPAANYSDSVQSRLRAYDNTVNDAPRREPAISLIEYRKKPSLNGKSLLKTNQSEDKETKKFMPPPSSTPKKHKDKSKKQLPPELIAINTPNAQGRKAIQNVLHNIQQLVKGVSASDPTEIAAAPLPNPVAALPNPVAPLPNPVAAPLPNPVAVPKPTSMPPPALSMPTLPMPAALPLPVVVPTPPKAEPEKKDKKEKSDLPKKTKASSKPWRPTLMPITPENLSRIAREPTQLAVDGRSLPSLVQVMSSGKRFHITLQDYNKMCFMRREKLQQLHEGERRRPPDEGAVVTDLPPSASLGNGGSVTHILDDKHHYSGNAATILKNVGLKNITIAPIHAKTSTITSPAATSPLIMTSTHIKIPQLGPSVSITSETVLTPNIPIMTSTMIMPKIPKSLTVIPQTVMAAVPQNVVTTAPQILDGPKP